jgi:hypothetical protein
VDFPELRNKLCSLVALGKIGDFDQVQLLRSPDGRHGARGHVATSVLSILNGADVTETTQTRF